MMPRNPLTLMIGSLTEFITSDRLIGRETLEPQRLVELARWLGGPCDGR